MKLILSLGLLFLLGCGSSGGSSTPAPKVDDMTVSTSFTCSKLDNGIGTTLTYTYQILRYSTGDVLAICSISAAAGQFSNTTFYRTTQPGATNGACIVGFDVDAASSGFWSFTAPSGNAQVKYLDAGSGHNNYTYSFLPGECTTN